VQHPAVLFSACASRTRYCCCAGPGFRHGPGAGRAGQPCCTRGSAGGAAAADVSGSAERRGVCSLAGNAAYCEKQVRGSHSHACCSKAWASMLPPGALALCTVPSCNINLALHFWLLLLSLLLLSLKVLTQRACCCAVQLLHACRIEQFEEQLNAAISRFAPGHASSSRCGTPTAAEFRSSLSSSFSRDAVSTLCYVSCRLGSLVPAGRSLIQGNKHCSRH
jgi:hypothetical protein